MDKASLDQLKAFVQLCQANPNVLYSPKLTFYKEWLESIGAKLPPAPEQQPGATGDSFEDAAGKSEPEPEPEMDQEPEPKREPAPEPEPSSSEESDIELDMEGVIEGDNDEPQHMGDDSLEVTEEMVDEATAKRSEAMAAVSDGNLDEAMKLFTEAIEKNPQSALLYAKRARNDKQKFSNITKTVSRKQQNIQNDKKAVK